MNEGSGLQSSRRNGRPIQAPVKRKGSRSRTAGETIIRCIGRRGLQSAGKITAGPRKTAPGIAGGRLFVSLSHYMSDFVLILCSISLIVRMKKSDIMLVLH